MSILVRGSHMNMQMSILDILYFLKKHLLKWVPNELKCLFKPKKHSVKMKIFWTWSENGFFWHFFKNRHTLRGSKMT